MQIARVIGTRHLQSKRHARTANPANVQTARTAVLHAMFALVDGRSQGSSVVASVSDAIPARLAHLAETAQIAHVDLTQIRTRRHAYYVKRASGVALLEQMTSLLAETVQSEDIRLPLEFRKSRGAIHAVLGNTWL